MSKPFTRSIYSAPEPREKYRASYTLPELRRRLRTAEAQTHPAPSEAQKKAGNYPKGIFRFRGLEVSIENPAGSIRSGKSKAGKEWSVVMPYAYGYLRRTLARDGDQVDVFLGPHLDSDVVFGVDQVDPKTGAYDETKWFLGWKSKDAAKQAYLDSYSPGWQGFLDITAMTFEQFKSWLDSGDATKPIGPQVTEKYSRDSAAKVKPRQMEQYSKSSGDKRIADAYRDTLTREQWLAVCKLIPPDRLAELRRQISGLALGKPEEKVEGLAGTVDTGTKAGRLSVWIKDFDPIKIEQDPDAVEGVNCYRDKSFVPDKQAWIDWDLGLKDRKPVVLHEIIECILMAHGWSYDPAHQAANRFEVAWRRELGVGVEKYSRAWHQLKNQGGTGPGGQWTAEDERKHPRGQPANAGQFGPGASGQRASAAKVQSPIPNSQSPSAKISIGGRAFEILKRGKDWLFRMGGKAPWSKATPAAADAIEKQTAQKEEARNLRDRHNQAKWGDVRVMGRAHRRAKGIVARLVQEILKSMAEQERQPDPAKAAQEKFWREKLNRHYLQLMRQTGLAYRQAKKERDTTAARLKRTPKYLEEVQDPETGEVLPRHALELRQKHARQVARLKLREQKQKWQQESAARWKQQMADWEAKRQERDAGRLARKAQGDAERAKKTAEQEAKTQAAKAKQLAADKLKAQMQAFYDANKRPELTPEQKAEERRKAENLKARQGNLAEKKAKLREIAAEEGIDPDHLQAAAESLAESKQPEIRQYNDALDHAVARSGLTPAKINKWEDDGGDHSSFPGFDGLADDMASDYPILGMGAAAGESGHGDAERLWDLLKQGKRRVPQWYDPEILQEASSHVGQSQHEYREPGEEPGELLGAGVAGSESFPWEKEDFARRRLKQFYARWFASRSTQGN